MAVNADVVLPAATEVVDGVTAMESSTAAVIVNVVLPLTPSVAVIVLVPVATAVASPVLASIVAFAGVPLVQVTEVVILAVEASE